MKIIRSSILLVSFVFLFNSNAMDGNRAYEIYNSFEKAADESFREIIPFYENKVLCEITAQYCENNGKAMYCLAKETANNIRDRIQTLSDYADSDYYTDSIYEAMKIPIMLKNEYFISYIKTAANRKRAGVMLRIESFYANLIRPIPDDIKIDEETLNDWELIKK